MRWIDKVSAQDEVISVFGNAYVGIVGVFAFIIDFDIDIAHGIFSEVKLVDDKIGNKNRTAFQAGERGLSVDAAADIQAVTHDHLAQCLDTEIFKRHIKR